VASNISGRELMQLLEKDGWIRRGRSTPGVFFYKHFPNERTPRTTVVPDKSDPLPETTLGAILSVKQTGLGKTGLQELIAKYR
jgi:predicted RNA binding protein YcfA (HicA-like mRNA interferase family)